MKNISETEFRQICHAIFDNADSTTSEDLLLQQLLVLTRARLGHSRPGTGAFKLEGTVSNNMIQEIVGLLLMRRDPFFETSKVINEFLENYRNKK